MLVINYQKYKLHFKFEAGTSRGVLTEKDTYFIKISDQDGTFGLGEAAPLAGLSIDATPDFEARLSEFCTNFNEDYPGKGENALLWLKGHTAGLPSVRFAVETALRDLANGGRRLVFDNAFGRGEKGIPINGLIWMGKKEFMLSQIEEKLAAGYRCIKMKIGAIDFEQELELLSFIRKRFSAREIVLRVDANGAFKPTEAMQKLEALTRYDLHSIEQPIRAGQVEEMARLCQQTPLPIALDEELIGIEKTDDKRRLLAHIKPQFIILKPTLTGGIQSSAEWIDIAGLSNIGWWMTSALESNIGLNAISQFTAEYNTDMPQGLGTGQLYHNNIDSPLQIRQGNIFYDRDAGWSTIS